MRVRRCRICGADGHLAKTCGLELHHLPPKAPPGHDALAWLERCDPRLHLARCRAAAAELFGRLKPKPRGRRTVG